MMKNRATKAAEKTLEIIAKRWPTLADGLPPELKDDLLRVWAFDYMTSGRVYNPLKTFLDALTGQPIWKPTYGITLKSVLPTGFLDKEAIGRWGGVGHEPGGEHYERQPDDDGWFVDLDVSAKEILEP